jgi:hypothetical protein
MKRLTLLLAFTLCSAHITFAQLTLTTNGKVGIGTSTPQANTKLHVTHNDFYAGYFTSTKASSLTHVIHAEFTGTSYHGVAVFGKSEMNPGWGYGGIFSGGLGGVVATATMTGPGLYRYALQGTANNGSQASYAVYGTSSSYAGYFNGNVTVMGTFSNPSDERLKENVVPVEKALEKLMGLDAKSFTFKRTGDYAQMNLPAGTRYGFLAQEFEAIFPELVREEAHPVEDEINGERVEKEPITYKAIEYIELIPLLVQAIKEQQAMIEELKAQISEGK